MSQESSFSRAWTLTENKERFDVKYTNMVGMLEHMTKADIFYEGDLNVFAKHVINRVDILARQLEAIIDCDNKGQRYVPGITNVHI